MSRDEEHMGVSSVSNDKQEETQQELEAVTLKRRRERRDKRRRQRSSGLTWHTVQVGLWGVLLVLSILFLLNPWAGFVPDDARQVLGEGRTLYWLAYENGSLVVGGLLGLATAVWGFFFLRDAINNRTNRYARACPACGSSYLKRMRRTRLNHLLCWLGIPSYRYICSDCQWQGSLIDHTRLRK